MEAKAAGVGGGGEAEVEGLRALLESMGGPLHSVLRCDLALDYPRCCCAASSLAARYLRDRGYLAEVIPFVRLSGIAGEFKDAVDDFLKLPSAEREPRRVRELFGGRFLEALLRVEHQGVGVRLQVGGEARYYLADFMVLRLHSGGGGDYVFERLDEGRLLKEYSLAVVSPKFLRYQTFESCLLSNDLGPVTLDLCDDYEAFNRLVGADKPV